MKNKKYDLYDLYGYSDDNTYGTFKDLISKKFDKFDIFSEYKNYWYDDTSETVSTEDPETVRLKKLAAERERKIDSILS